MKQAPGPAAHYQKSFKIVHPNRDSAGKCKAFLDQVTKF